PLLGAPFATAFASSTAEALVVFILQLPAKNLIRIKSRPLSFVLRHWSFAISLRPSHFCEGQRTNDKGPIPYRETNSPVSTNSFPNTPAICRNCPISSLNTSGSSACGPSHCASLGQ